MTSKQNLAEVSRIDEKERVNRSRGAMWRLMDQLSRRKVCRTAISYVVVMWINLQIGDVIFPMIGLPDWSLRLIIVIGVMGFPVVLILSWAFQVTSRGIVLGGDGETDSGADRKLDVVVNVLLLCSAIILSVLLLLQFFAKNGPLLAVSSADEAVATVMSSLSFEAATEESANRVMAQRVHEELRHRLINLQGIELLPDNTELNLKDARRRVSLAGSLLLESGKAHVIAYLIDQSVKRYVMSIAFSVDMDASLAAQSATAERIVKEVERALFGDRMIAATGRGT